MGRIDPTAVNRIDSVDGWSLEARVYRNEDALLPGRRPVLLVPGYAMNSFILGYHPAGESLVASLVTAGLEVWTVNLRGQGGALSPSRPPRYGLAELALDDLPLVIDHVLANTLTGADRVDPIGCSLGASLLYAYLAHHPTGHRCGACVAIGGPLRWDTVHPVMKAAFRSSRLAGAVPVRGTRRLARRFFPVLTKMPSVLSIYMNIDEIDVSQASELVETIDDPVPYINRQLARWIRQRDLVVRGVNVPQALRSVADARLLVLLANADGIVTPEAALSAVDAWRPGLVDVLEVGSEERWYAHADLFISNHAQHEVFAPLADWLTARAGDVA